MNAAVAPDSTGQTHTAASILRRARRGQLRHLGASSFFLSCHQVAEALVPVTIGLAVDRAVATGDGPSMLWWLAALLGLFVVLTCAMRWGFRANLRATQGAGHDLRMLLAERVLDPRGAAGAERMPGELVSLATGDALKVGMLNYATAMAISGFAGVGVAVVALVRFSLPLTALVTAGSVLLLVITHVLGRPLEHRSAAERAKMAAATGLAADLIAGLRVLKGFGGERPAVARYRSASREALGATLRSAAAESTVRAVAVVLAGGLLAAVTLVAGRLAAGGSISIGALITAVGLAQFLVDPLNRITGFGSQRAQSLASAGRIAAILDAPHAVGGTRQATAAGPGRLRFEGFSAGTIRGLDLEVAAGEFVGIVASDPKEAAALLAVLARDADPETGTVLLDGESVAQLYPDETRSVVLVAPHDAELFEGTVADNIRSAAPGAELGPVVAAAGLDDLEEVLSEGLRTRLLHGGVSLSGGQRQRVALARALAADVPVLVLHEPTTAVDSLTELKITQGVRQLRDGASTVCVTSSPAVLSFCDRVVVLDGGVITTEGTHEELVGSHPRYRELVLA
ncbi:ABC transporter [Parafrankia soli]|uniref:ABC transporter n=1 Tax=Parafrankia soli TaxID=2599596 RepID=A0A1S1PGJ2_9ACTN|nr:ABC transporter ATP-binding protein [Parafrankia soli]OHV20327.1 ABC transporter [Parafrankia soli]